MGLEHGEDGFCCGACKVADSAPSRPADPSEKQAMAFPLDAAGNPIGATLRTATGESFALPSARVVVGRSAPANVVLGDRMISRLQFELEFTASEVWIRDLGSACGTVVDGQRIGRSQRLRAGAPILVGNSVLFLQQSPK